ncbi:MAG: hypothetical protein QXG03_07210 [Halalkalicoccus sp.]
MARAPAVEADLSLTVEGHPVSVSGSGTHLTIATSSLRAAVTVLGSLGTLAELVEPFGSRFVEADLSADVEVDGVVVARIGPHVEPNALSRALGIAPARLWPGALCRAALRELRG